MRASKAALICCALCAACSAESPNQDTRGYDGGGGAAGSFGGVSGQMAVNGGVGGATSTATAGASGSFAQAGAAAGGAGGIAAGTGGQAGSTGSGGSGGGAGTAGIGGDAGLGGQAGDAGTSGSGGTAGMSGSGSIAAGCEVSPITDAMRDQYDNMNDDYYVKFASANGVIVATGAGVDDQAITRYCLLLTEMFSNDDVRAAILDENMWFTMISEDEQLSSLPQIASTYGAALDARARGLGGLTPTICAEDSIMCMPGDPWDGDCICPHETGHTLYSSGIAKVPALSSRLSAITDAARASGRIANSYVWQDGDESGMMAWGVQVWYDCAIDGSQGAYHPDINTRAELQSELPDLYQFLSELLPSDNRYEDCYAAP